MSFDKVYEMNSIYDPKHLNNNTFLTIHRIYSYNPFANCTYFTEAAKPTISLNKSTETVAVGANKTLTATATPADATVTFESSDETKATVTSAGKVTGVAAGEVTITAKATTLAGVASAKCVVTVTAN